MSMTTKIPEKEERENSFRPIGECALKCAEKISDMLDKADDLPQIIALTAALSGLMSAMSERPRSRWRVD